MKRFVSAMLAMILAFSSMGTFAAANDTLSTEGLLGSILNSVAGVFESPEFAFEYTQKDAHLSGGILQDQDGLAVIAGEIEEDGQVLGATISSEGVILRTGEGAQGMRWPQISELILEELGLNGLGAIAPEDTEVFAKIFSDIAADISQQAISSITSHATFSGMAATKYALAINVDRLAGDVNAAVPRAIMKNRAELDEVLERWMPLIRDVFPEVQEEIDSAELINQWNALGLSQFSTGGMTLRLDILATGTLMDPWKITISGANITFEAWLTDGRFQFVLDTGMDKILAFDSADLEYLMELALTLPQYITQEALSFGDTVGDGMRRIAFDLDGVRLQQQIVTGVMKVIAANRNGIDVLLNKYRPWIELFAPEAAFITADELVMALTVMNMNARYFGISTYLGLRGIASDNIHIDISYPVEEIICPAEPVVQAVDASGNPIENAYGAVPVATSAERRTWPVTVELSFDTWSFSYYRGETTLDVSYVNPYGRNWQLTGDYDRASDSVSATLSQIYRYSSREYMQSLNIYVDEHMIRLYTGDGEVNLTIDILENKAVLSGTVDDEAVSGECAWSDGLVRLNLFDGYDMLEATLRYCGDGAELVVNFSGVVLSGSVEWSKNGFSLEFSMPDIKFGAGIEMGLNGVSVDWHIEQISAAYFSSGALTLSEYTIELNLRMNDKRYGGQQKFVIEACWYPEYTYLDIRRDGGVPYRTGDDFELVYHPGQISYISGGQMLQISDVTPAGSSDRNITQITLYDGYAYRDGNSRENTVELNECYTRYELVTTVEDECYHITLCNDGEELYTLILDFSPDAAQIDAQDVLWLTPELFRLMFGLVKLESMDPEMPIQVYAEEAPAQAEAVENTPEQTALFLELPVDKNADPDTILQLQMRLYSLGLVSTDGLEEGVLDQKTLRAVADFQNRINGKFEANLSVIDPADPNAVIDADTLLWLFEKEF